MSGPAKTRVVGRPYMRVDGPAKVTGQTKFADDLMLPRMLHCKLLRSKIAHARILSIDVSKALAAPGVVAVATGRDLPIPFGILPVSQDEHALCTDRVRFVGDPVAAIAAVDEDAAFDALDLIDVRYEPLLPVGTLEEGLAPAATPIHDYGDAGNIHKLVAMEFGDTEDGFARADRVYEDLYFYEGNTHLPLEQHAAVADFSADGKLTLWSSTQTPHYVHRALAKVLEMPPARIRVIATPNGGGFGGKSDPFNHEIVVAHLSRMTGRPVKICLTREEVFYCHRGRHPTLMKVRTGVRRDGAITAMHFQTLLDGGGYGSYGVASTYYTGALQTVTYEVPTYRFEGARVFTNKPPCGPKRGHGTPQPQVLGDRFLLFAKLHFVETRPQDLHGLCAVLDLRFLVLLRDDDAGRDVGEADGRVGGVDALSAGAARAERVHAQVLFVDLDVDFLGLGQDGHGDRRGVNPSARFRGGHSLHAVHAALVLQLAVDAAALDRRNDFLEAADAGVVARHDLDAPALPLGELAVHAEQLGREQRRFVAAGAGANLEHHVLFVVRILGHQQLLELANQHLAAPDQRLELLLRQLLHVGVRGAGQLLGLGDVARDGLVLAEALDDRLDLGEELRLLAVLGRIALDLGRAELLHELLVLPFDRPQACQTYLDCAWGPTPMRSSVSRATFVSVSALG